MDDGEDDEERDPLLEAVEQSTKEEKLKVVVRMRPLQPQEVAWWTRVPSNNGIHPNHEQQLLKDPLDLANPRPATIFAQTPGYASKPWGETSQMCLQDNSIMWEKNGQMKILVTDAVFDHQVAQDKVFQSVEDCVDGLLAGYDCSVFAYGQTGTGKTFTMSGLDLEEDLENKSNLEATLQCQEAGVVPRAINKLFEEIAKATTAEQGVAFSVYCSFIEIYNEKIYDVLSVDPLTQALKSQGVANCNATKSGGGPGGGGGDAAAAKQIEAHGSLLKSIYLQRRRAGWNRTKPVKEVPNLCIRQKLDGSVFVDGLTLRNISTKADMLQAFIEGSRNREVRDNLYNEHSSRGHSIFQVTLRKSLSTQQKDPTNPESTQAAAGIKTNGSNTIRLSRLFFVDLAGSEKWHIHGSDLGDKYAAELSSINKSLSALTNCVVALGQKDRIHVPYRDSILTRLLQTCLQGIGKTTFIVTLSPAHDSLEESFATLRFAERLKALRSMPIRKKAYTSELMGEQRLFYEKQMQSMRLEVTRLRELLKKAQKKNSEIAEHTASVANTALLEENRRLKELLMHSQQQKALLPTENHKPNAVVVAPADSPARSTTEEENLLQSYSSPVARMPVMKERDNNNNTYNNTIHHPNKSQSFNSQHPISTMMNPSMPTTMMSPKREEFDTLVTKLHSKEAKLNWMLEAEMEAQNTKNMGFTGLEPLPSKIAAADDLNASPKSPQPVPPPRVWLVEKRLIRPNVMIPAPLRSSQNTSTEHEQKQEPMPSRREQPLVTQSVHVMSRSDMAMMSPRQQQQQAPPARILPALVSSTERKAQRIEMLISASQEPFPGTRSHRAAKPPGRRKEDATRQPQLAKKLEPLSPRRSIRPEEPPVVTGSIRTQARQLASIIHPKGVVVQPQHPAKSHEPVRPTAITATRYASPARNIRNRQQRHEPPQQQPLNAASILKLMGSNEINSSGITKEELVEQYKRARRAELEILMRSMVQS